MEQAVHKILSVSQVPNHGSTRPFDLNEVDISENREFVLSGSTGALIRSQQVAGGYRFQVESKVRKDRTTQRDVAR